MANKDLTGKTVFITGSSRGIGKATAYAFARQKCQLILTYLTSDTKAKEIVKKCRQLGAKEVFLVKLDIGDNKSIKNAVDQVIDKYAKIDILINNAGVLVWKELDKHSPQEIEKQLRINLEGSIKVTHACLGNIKETIINVASIAAKTGFSGLTTYCASKFGLRGFSQALAQELKNIKVYVVNPGMTATQMTDYQGVAPEKVADKILLAAQNSLPTGSDIDLE